MKIISVDNEKMAVEYMERLLWQVEPEAEYAGFTKVEDAFAYLSEHPVDVALLDIEMGKYSGLELAKQCKELCPNINIIFVTGYSQYTMDAIQLRCSGYLMKPVRADDLRIELENLRHPLPLAEKRVQIQTFGNFEVFIDGKALRVPRKKCKECLAYLVDRRGAGVTYAQISSVLWEYQPVERAIQKNTHKIIAALWQSLKEVNVADILIRTRTDIALDVGKVDCDYLRAINGDMAWMNSFTGEYMTNYSWAEFTLGELVEIKKRNA